MAITPPESITQAWGHISWAELLSYTDRLVLRNSDVISMFCGLERRDLFLYCQLVEIALRMPQYFHKPSNKLIREIGNDLFPSGYLNLKRLKVGLDLPMSRWIRDLLRKICLNPSEALEQAAKLDSAWATIKGKFLRLVSITGHEFKVWLFLVDLPSKCQISRIQANPIKLNY
ncbi:MULTISPECIES: asparagine synthase-related protein [unclassified Synechococcus]|uniref:asparagine synthase-related protein n=1 Tax=unclassified Synechococcus TaxID=2626047 RepID=UPI0039B10D41